MISWWLKQCKRSQNDQSIDIYYLYSLFDLFIIDRWWIYFRLYYYLDRSNGSLIVWWWYKNQDFVLHRLKSLLIVDPIFKIVIFMVALGFQSWTGGWFSWNDIVGLYVLNIYLTWQESSVLDLNFGIRFKSGIQHYVF